MGVDKDLVHYLVQSVSTYSVTKLVTMINSLTAREMFKKSSGLKKELWGGGEFWSDGYFASRVGNHGKEGIVKKYVESQGKDYSVSHLNNQQPLF